MKEVLAKLASVGLVITDNRHLGMGMNIVSQPNLKYVSIIRKEDKFHINTVGVIISPSQAQAYGQELLKVGYLVKTINNAIEDKL